MVRNRKPKPEGNTHKRYSGNKLEESLERLWKKAYKPINQISTESGIAVTKLHEKYCRYTRYFSVCSSLFCNLV